MDDTACLGQMTLNKEQAGVLGHIFGLTADEQKRLQVVPYKGTLPTSVPTDPLIYRGYEIVSVYGATTKELIHQEFGDDIMSAIDFSMHSQRQADPRRPHQRGALGQVPAVQDVQKHRRQSVSSAARHPCACVSSRRRRGSRAS